MVREVAAQPALGEDVLEAVVARTDGVPLFVEELTRSVVEGDRAAGTIPATLQDTLMARLDRLGEAREVIQTASVIGREFDYGLVELAGRGDSDPRRCCLAYNSRGVTRYALGGFVDAQADLDRAIQSYVAERHANELLDPRAATYPWLGLTVWQGGRRETARRLMSDVVTVVDAAGRPFDLGYIRIFQLALAVYDEALDTARRLASELSRLGGELAFPVLVAQGEFYTGYVMAPQPSKRGKRRGQGRTSAPPRMRGRGRGCG